MDLSENKPNDLDKFYKVSLTVLLILNLLIGHSVLETISTNGIV